MEDESLDLYLDGLLPEDEAARFERAHADALAERVTQASIDDALRRRYAAPVGLASRVLTAADETSPEPELAGPAGGRSAGLESAGSVWAAAAVFLVGAFLGWRLLSEADVAPGDPPPKAGIELAGLGAAEGGRGELGPALTEGIDGMADDPGGSDADERGLVPSSPPDLEALYEQLTGELAAGSLVAWSQADASAGAPLVRIADRYDECLDVSSPSCALVGPYASPEWPSATVLVGFCDGADRAPSLLVVDDQTMTGCGITPTTGELSPFYKEVNGLAVWEVSEADSPRLLDVVRPCVD